MNTYPSRFSLVLPNTNDRLSIVAVGITDTIESERIWMTKIEGELRTYSLDANLAYRRDTDITNMLDAYDLATHSDLLAMFEEGHYRPVAISITPKNMEVDDDDLQDT